MKLEEINNYWLDRFHQLEEDYPICFVCGKDKRLEKCHLIPKALGGSNEVDNLVLLCNEHHKQAPNISLDKEIMLNWIEQEAKEYCRSLNMRNKDVKSIFDSVIKVGKRLFDKFGEDIGAEKVNGFLFDKYAESTLQISSHQQANTRTRVLFFDYMSNYDGLESDFLKYIESKTV